MREIFIHAFHSLPKGGVFVAPLLLAGLLNLMIYSGAKGVTLALDEADKMWTANKKVASQRELVSFLISKQGKISWRFDNNIWKLCGHCSNKKQSVL